LIGLVLASMFAATMAMTTSDTNTISSVITRDILPIHFARFRNLDQRQSLRVARVTTLLFTSLTLLVGVEADRFGGILSLLISWFAALIGPVSVPMLFGLLPAFRHAGAGAASASILGGFVAFVLATSVFSAGMGVKVLAPIATSLAFFCGLALVNRGRPVPRAVDELLRAVSGKSEPAAP
jgi:Na+/proline symporter